MLKPISLLLAISLSSSFALAKDVSNTATPASASTAQASTPAAASDAEAAKRQFMLQMQHANPVPNYMVIIQKHAADLKLNPEQQAKVKQWYDENNAKAAEVVKKIVAAEQALAEASLKGEDITTIMQQFDEMAAMRRALAEQKTKCRDYMRDVLTPEQWQQVVELQTAALRK